MSLKSPSNVTLNCQTRILQWNVVDCADGYNVHENGQYTATITGNKYAIPESLPLEGWSVSAYIKVESENGQTLAPDEAHTPRTDAMLICTTLDLSLIHI